MRHGPVPDCLCQGGPNGGWSAGCWRGPGPAPACPAGRGARPDEGRQHEPVDSVVLDHTIAVQGDVPVPSVVHGRLHAASRRPPRPPCSSTWRAPTTAGARRVPGCDPARADRVVQGSFRDALRRSRLMRSYCGVSGCPGVRVSGCPGVRVSGCPGVRVSGCPGVRGGPGVRVAPERAPRPCWPA